MNCQGSVPFIDEVKLEFQLTCCCGNIETTYHDRSNQEVNVDTTRRHLEFCCDLLKFSGY